MLTTDRVAALSQSEQPQQPFPSTRLLNVRLLNIHQYNQNEQYLYCPLFHVTAAMLFSIVIGQENMLLLILH